jgi:outer membrane protein, heavy metal efflux system
MKNIIGILAMLVCSAYNNPALAQDTLRLSFPQAEKLFLQNNLQLIAAHYNVDIGKALVKQAKLWDNPYLVTDQNIYDGKFFRHNNNNGQVYIQVQQLIRTAGKIKKQTQLADDNVMMAQEQMDDLMRSLKYALVNDLLSMDELLDQNTLYNLEIRQVSKLVAGMEEVYKTGNIALKDLLRLKALLFGLQNDLDNVLARIFPLQGELKMLLRVSDSSFIMPESSFVINSKTQIAIPPMDSLVSLAMQNRPDAAMAQTQLDFQHHNLLYQKALAKPDITLGPEYDRLSNYTPNYVGLGVSLPLNIFNHNQGNIEAAKIQVRQQQTQWQWEQDRIHNEVGTALGQYLYWKKINNTEQDIFSGNYESMLGNMLQAYRDRKISLLDFTDFLDSYKENKLKLQDQHYNLRLAMANLNYTVNTPLFSF